MAMPLSLLVLLAASASVRSSEDGRHQVIIVGAGVSGFAAAATLLEHNVTDVLILEASDRIGGRIHTVQFGGSTIDKGAEFIYGEEGNSVYKLANPHNLLTSYSPYLFKADSFIYADTSGKVYNSDLVKGLVDKAHQISSDDEIGQFQGSVSDYLIPRMKDYFQSKNVDKQLSEAVQNLVVEMLCVYDGADDLSQVGARGDYQKEDNLGDPMMKWKTGGYSTVFELLSKKIPDPSEELPVKRKVQFRKRVTRIERKNGEVLVKTEDGRRYIADHVIFTPSLGVLKKHAKNIFHPSLPAEKTAAIEALGFGCVGKVFMQFPSRWWPKNINSIVPLLTRSAQQDFESHSVHGSWTSKTTGFYPVMNNDRMLCAWFSGDACRKMESLSDREVSEGLTELLKRLVGKSLTVRRPVAITRSNWASDPNIRGAYSFRSVASDEKNISNKDLAKPVTDSNGKPLLLFAGEATHPRYSSTVHGALDSGRREAHHILEYLRGPQ